MNERALELATQLRKIAAPVGPMHAFWDVIFDLEEGVKGRRAFFPLLQAIAMAERCLAERSVDPMNM